MIFSDLGKGYGVKKVNILGLNFLKYKKIESQLVFKNTQSFNVIYPSLTFLAKKKEFSYHDSILGPHNDWLRFVEESIFSTLLQLCSDGTIKLCYSHSLFKILNYKKFNSYGFYIALNKQQNSPDCLVNDLLLFFKAKNISRRVDLYELIKFIFDLNLGKGNNHFCNPNTAEVAFILRILSRYSKEGKGVTVKKRVNGGAPFKSYHISTNVEFYNTLNEDRKAFSIMLESLNETNFQLINVFKKECLSAIEKVISEKSDWDTN